MTKNDAQTIVRFVTRTENRFKMLRRLLVVTGLLARATMLNLARYLLKPILALFLPIWRRILQEVAEDVTRMDMQRNIEHVERGVRA